MNPYEIQFPPRFFSLLTVALSMTFVVDWALRANDQSIHLENIKHVKKMDKNNIIYIYRSRFFVCIV